MANQQEGISDEFLEQILAYNDGGGFAGTGAGMVMGMMNSGGNVVPGSGSISGGSGFPGTVFPLGLSLEQGKGGFAKQEDASGSGNRFRDEQEGKRATAKTEREAVHFTSLFPAFGHSQSQQHSLRPNTQQPYHAQTTTASVAVLPHPPVVRPRVRARRGQATDPHSIAERLRRERIAERMKQLQELVPNSNKTDRAAMLDDIVDYVKFLRLQVKVLSMSRLGGTGAVAQLVADIPLPTVEGEGGDGGSGSGSKERAWEKWSTDGTERQVAKLMEEDVGAAMQFLQSKALCIMPITLASAIYHTHQPDTHGLIKTEHNAPS